MGSFNGEEICELIGILDTLKEKIFSDVNFGIYDNGLAAVDILAVLSMEKKVKQLKTIKSL